MVARSPWGTVQAMSRTAQFVHPEALAGSEWLADRLGDPLVKFVNTRYIIEADHRCRFI